MDRFGRNGNAVGAEHHARAGFYLQKSGPENVDAGEAGGIYLFSDKTSAEQYAAMHIKRVAQMGATDIRSRIFDINVPLTHITRGNLKPAS
ncbi:Putative monooxygenase ydhR [Hafnia alvei]|uniref:Monooxygenase ydhR n=1 Tax=Hafnia alvei TaxID=569 RepID=A0A377PJK3_HAFAL|nr:Putative monooxygenase ydhR [Hafnia alvei]